MKQAAPIAPIVISLMLVCLAACSVPIAPGYRIVKESRDVRFVSGAAPQLQIRSSYTLVNSGNGDLSFVDVNLPAEQAYGRTGLRAAVDGREVSLQRPSVDQPSDASEALRIPFESLWRQKQTRSLEIDYSFVSPADYGERITLAGADFHLGPRGAFPVLQPPKHFLAPFPKRPLKVLYTVRVPPDFRVLSSGVAAGRKQQGAETEYRFRLSAEDLSPYVAGGRYQESSVRGDPAAPIFWTFHPVTIGPASSRQIEDAWDTLEKDFGSLERNTGVPYVVESERLRGRIAGEAGPAAVAFPRGALVNSAAIAEGIQSDTFLDRLMHALARDWFGDQVFPSPDSALGIGEGLPEYATIVIEEARGGEVARRRRILQYLDEYDAAVRLAPELTLAVSMLSDPPARRRIALAKAPLFFVALEDACGSAAMYAGLTRIVTLLRGQEISYNTLRATLEQASGKNLAPVFRVWLNQKGIPTDFRARYAESRTNIALNN